MSRTNKWDQVLQEIKQEISKIQLSNLNIEAKLDSCIHRLEQKFVNLEKHVNQQLQLAERKTDLIELKLKTETDELKTFEKKCARDQILSDLYSKRNNLIIYGLPERENNERRDKSRQLVKNFLKDKLKIDQDISILDAHRMGPHVTSEGKHIKSRPLLFKMASIFEKDLIMSNLINLKPAALTTRQIVYVKQHLPACMAQQKARLHGKFKDAQKAKQKTRWKIDYTTADYCLYINDTKVSFDD